MFGEATPHLPEGFRYEKNVITAGEEEQSSAGTATRPYSAYFLRGPSRTEWEHSIPGVPALRYSITFRNLKA